MPTIRRFLCAVAVFACVWPVAARQPVRARHAMVVTREMHATDAGLKVLQSGGNAVDAAVAVAFALAVTHPSAGNLGGGGFMLVRLANGTSNFIDFRERAPKGASHDMYLDPTGKPTEDSLIGYRASGIPGTVRGMEFAHKKYGKKSWKSDVDPALNLAAKGFPVSWALAQALHSDGVSSKLNRFPDSKRIFLRDGKFYEAGDTLLQPELAKVLKRIRDKGARDFYEGQTAQLLASDMQSHGGLVTLDDLKNYRVIERQPLTGSYRGYTIITAPPPSSGGVGILQMMGVLEGTSFAREAPGSAASLHLMAEAMRRYFADRSEYLGDPAFTKVPVTALLNKEYIAGLRSTIDPAHATPSDLIHPGKLTVHESTETTHYSIVDSEGNAVAVTYTLNGSYGSGVTATGLGFLLNNEMDDFAPKPGSPNAYGLIQGEANAVAAGKTPLSSMVPTVVLKDGKLFMVVGTPGGPTIINSVLQTILNVLDYHMNMQEAVDQPRIHHQWLPDSLSVEKTVGADTIELLKQRGHTVRVLPQIGEMAAILVDGEWLQGAADARTEGTAKGY
jgi:gamma-glutamyltranspeptidase/glutathione hydrolase